jgi:glycosyltransferase involved in cell wall biosynthesis
MKKPLLSICIPTYNRSEYLYSNLLSIFSQIKNPEIIEVLVSDNNSNDETISIVSKFLKYSNFIFLRQEENIGPAKNFLSVVSQAKGEYCWIIGDDDFILQGRIESIIALISNNRNINFFYAKVIEFPLDNYTHYKKPFQTLYFEDYNVEKLDIIYLDKWEMLLSSKYSIVFMGEVMAGIFKKSVWESFKIYPEKDMYASLESIYPHCVIYANTLMGQKAIYIQTPVILALSGTREWFDKLGYILIVYIKKLLNLYRDKGLSGKLLKECYVTYIKITLPSALKFLIKGNENPTFKVSLSNYFLFLLTHPISTFLAFLYFLRLIARKLLSIRNS